ncbi:MAG TPA: serine/threonine-protein kinase [Kofleriaceae bacterium]|nr:serine/threonine-protein kinase [Kofleriaceae bacterium]
MEHLGENTVIELLDALVTPERREEIDRHTVSCERCRRLISELVRRSSQAEPPPAPVEPRTLARGTRIDRYEIEAQIGEGATGAVYTAFDPDLDRRVALKLLHPGTRAQRDRILHEARALAAIVHPNVVAAYDIVEREGDLVLAMELVEGHDLRAVTTATASVADVLAAYEQAGRGLAAAHAGGLVHRDFKPANVLVGRDGRVRLGDFGLAARRGGVELVGTPAYMAPELFDGEPADAASDQFAFCVALYEALYGERPFAANFVDEIARTPLATTGSGRAPVPRHVREALARGLAADPRRRFPSMDALVAALAAPHRRGRAWIVVAAGSALALAVFGIARLGDDPPSPCRDEGLEIGAVWNPARSAMVHDRFVGTHGALARPAWAAVERGMTGFAKHWSDQRREACEATRVRGVQSDQVLTLREVCLQRALGEADALANVLAQADRGVVERASVAVDGLPSLDECANVTALLAPVAPPAGRDTLAVGRVQGKLARGRALRDAGRWADARVVAHEAVADAAAIAHEPTRAAAWFLLGEAFEGAGDATQAEAALREAFSAAQRGHDDLLAARAATELVYVLGAQASRFDGGREWAFHARTMLDRAGGDLETEARLVGDLGHIAYSKNDYAAARDAYQKAYDLRVKLHGPNTRAAARALYNLGRAAMGLDDNRTAHALTARSLEVLEANLGPGHPDLVTALDGLGTIEFNQGEFAHALATLDRALAIARTALDRQHPEVGRVQANRGFALLELHRARDAEAAFTEALAIFDREGGDPMMVAEVVAALGRVDRALGERDRARERYRRALALREQIFGKQSAAVARSLEDLAELDADLGHHREARAGYEAALAIHEHASDPDNVELAYPLAGLGEAELALGRPADAIAPLERAVALLASYDGDRGTLGDMRLALARALWDAGRDRARARELAAAAEADLAGVPGGVERARAWRRSH